MEMEFRHLRYFIAVSETLNFTKAAQRLHIAQPPLSRQIRQLEEEIGVKLFIRDRRKVELSDAGRVSLVEARNLIQQAANAIEAAHRAQKGEMGTVRIGIGLGLGENVNRALIEHSKRFPEVDVQVKDIPSSVQIEALRERKIDAGFLRPPIDLINLASEAIFKEPFMVLLRKSDPLARRKKVRLRELAHEALLLHEREISVGVYDKVLELYRQAGVAPKIIQTRTGPYEEAGAILVASGKGIYVGVGGVLSHPVFGSGVIAVPLDEPEATIEVHVAWRKDEKSAAVFAFLDSVRRAFKSLKQSRRRSKANPRMVGLASR